MGYQDNLTAHLEGFRSAPFLFVGSGMSRRYLGLETWAGLLEKFAASTSRPYPYYVSSANGQLPAVAALIADAFHGVWWDNDSYKESRNRYSDQATYRSSPLKFEIADHVAAAIENIPTTGVVAEELDALRSAVVDGVITTNYDPLMETVFEGFKVFVGQNEMLFSDPQGVGEIYKIHGSCTSPNSLVLTKEDYDNFEKRNAYLAAKLLTIFVEHPILFLGYSLSDPNVTDLLVSIARGLTSENLGMLQNRLIFVQWDPDTTVSTLSATAIAVEGFTIPVISVKVADFRETFASLGAIRRKFPARLLRQLKEHVYQLVLSNEPTGALYVQDIENMDPKKVDVVVGVGIQSKLMGDVGYLGLDRRDLLFDVLREESGYDAETLVLETLPAVVRRPGNVPMFRYLREADLLTQKGDLRARADVDDRVRRRVEAYPGLVAVSKSVKTRAEKAVKEAGSDLAALIQNQKLTDALAFATAIPPSKIDLDQLRDFLVENSHCIDSGHTTLSTPWAKLVCFYDYLRYGVST